MQRILLAAAVLITFVSHAQHNWAPVEQNGFAYGATFKLSQVFQNKLYVAGDTNMGSHPLLYASTTGDPGTFVEETGIQSLLQPVNETKILSSTANTNYMFLGTQGYYDTLMGYVTGQVYRYDGTSYVKHGTINYGMQPSDEYSYATVNKLASYSPTGTNDSVYAFTTKGFSNYVTLFKAPASVTNPTWTQCASFPNTFNVNDAVVWHNKLYVSVSSISGSGGLILRTADGVTWDTVTTATSLQYYIGAFYTSCNFQQLEVFNDTLIAGASNSVYGLFYTNDSLAQMQTWAPFIDSLSNTGTSSWYGVLDMQVAVGKLWVEVDYNNWYPSIYYVGKSSIGHDSLFRSSASSMLETGTNSYSDYDLDYFNGKLYTVGHQAPPALVGNTNKAIFGTAGNIYRFYPINPTAAFTDTVSTGQGFCPYTTVYLVNQSVNASSYEWFMNGSHYSYAQDTSFYSFSAGTFTFELVAYNGTYQSNYKDSVTQTITINPLPTPVAAWASSYTVCQGEPDTLHVLAPTTGTGPYTYSWYDVTDGIPYTSDTVTTIQLYTVPQFSPYVIVSLSVKDANNCVDNSNSVYIYVNASDSLSGNVVDTLINPVQAGKVYLFRLNPLHPQTGDTVGSVSLGTNGYYYFPSLLYGNYIAKAEADTSNPLYKTAIGTYYSNKVYAFQWDSALVIQHHSCVGGMVGGNNIQILQMQGYAPGPGTVTGQITYDSSYTAAKLIGGGMHTLGAPLKGVDVKLGKNPGGSPAARTTTDTSGNFTFTGVPLGNYKIYVDIPNYGMDSVRAISLTSTNSNSTNNDYYVDSTMIRVIPIFNTTAAICSGDSILLGGAYQHNNGTYSDTLNVFGHDSVVVTTLTVKPLPILNVQTANDTICNGNSTVLNAIGNSTSYLWSANAGSATTPTVSVSPTSTATFVVTGTLNGCSDTKSVIVVVKSCIGIQSYSQNGFALYPNPAADKVYLQSDKNGVLKVINITGQVVAEQKVLVGQNEINVSGLPAGAYEVSVSAAGAITNLKLMISK